MHPTYATAMIVFVLTFATVAVLALSLVRSLASTILPIRRASNAVRLGNAFGQRRTASRISLPDDLVGFAFLVGGKAKVDSQMKSGVLNEAK
jgi:hypothetical protein